MTEDDIKRLEEMGQAAIDGRMSFIKFLSELSPTIPDLLALAREALAARKKDINAKLKARYWAIRTTNEEAGR